MTKKLTAPMIEALRVACVCATVWVGARWERGVGAVKSGTLCALIDRGLIVRNPRAEWEPTDDGYRAMHTAGLITYEALIAELESRNDVIQDAHAAAHVFDEKRSTARAFLSTPPGARLTDDEIEAALQVRQGANERLERLAGIDSAIEQVRGLAVPAKLCLLEHGYVKPCQQDRGHAGECDKETVGLVRKTGDVPAKPCSHGIALGRCSICREDADEGVPPILTPAVDETEHLGTPEPRKLDTWLTEGMILIDPKTFSGARYRFVDWVRGGAKLINVLNGGVRVVPQSSVMDWKYIPSSGAQTTLGGDQRARCAVKMPPRSGESDWRTCRLTVNADGVCPDVNHRSPGTEIRYASINAKLITDREEAQQALRGLRCAVAELAGRWQADSSQDARLFGEALASVLQEHCGFFNGRVEPRQDYINVTAGEYLGTVITVWVKAGAVEGLPPAWLVQRVRDGLCVSAPFNLAESTIMSNYVPVRRAAE